MDILILKFRRGVGQDKILSGNTQTLFRCWGNVTVESYNFQVVKHLVYLGSKRMTVDNRCFFGLGWQLKSRAISRRIKSTLYKSLSMPVLLRGAEKSTMQNKAQKAMRAFERTIPAGDEDGMLVLYGVVRMDDNTLVK